MNIRIIRLRTHHNIPFWQENNGQGEKLMINEFIHKNKFKLGYNKNKILSGSFLSQQGKLFTDTSITKL